MNTGEKYGPLVRRIHPPPESTQQPVIGGDTAEPSPFWVRPEEREAVKQAMKCVISMLDGIVVKDGGLIHGDTRPILNAILDRFNDPRNQGAV